VAPPVAYLEPGDILETNTLDALGNIDGNQGVGAIAPGYS
jgi:hypothetical protein